jgi:hypothetical protein
MKKLGLVLLLIAALASPAMAGPTGQVQGGYSYTADGLFGPYRNAMAGGEYTFTQLGGEWFPLTGYANGTTRNVGFLAPANSFQTFCIEATTEPISGFPAIYNAEITNTVQLANNRVSQGTGWLYQRFAIGSLTGYNYVGQAARQGSAYLLQQTLWWLEGYTINPLNIFSAAVIAQFGSSANAMMNGGENYGVYALNLTFARGGAAQDMLVYVPDGGATLMLLGGALMGLGALRRKFRA